MTGKKIMKHRHTINACCTVCKSMNICTSCLVFWCIVIHLFLCFIPSCFVFSWFSSQVFFLLYFMLFLNHFLFLLSVARYENWMQMCFQEKGYYCFPPLTIDLTWNTQRTWIICSFPFVFLVPVNAPYYWYWLNVIRLRGCIAGW